MKRTLRLVLSHGRVCAILLAAVALLFLQAIHQAQQVGCYLCQFRCKGCTPLMKLCCQRPPSPCPNPESVECSLPVNIFSGEVTLSAVDLEVPSRGFPFRWERSYASRARFDFGHGHNWSYNYQRRIGLPKNGRASVVDGTGREDSYVDLGNGTFASPQSIYEVLVQNLDSSFTQASPDGMAYTHDSAGYLTAIEDRNGNCLTIQRNAFHNITIIRDTQDREYTVAYTDATAAQRVASLTDFTGRQVQYTYDGNGDLIRVRSPIVTGTATGGDNEYPSGKTTLYTYSSGFQDPSLNHNLLSVVDPAYNVANDPLLSRASVTLTYGTNPTEFNVDRVIVERWGHDQGGPASNPNVVVGGTTTFCYQTNLSADQNKPSGTAVRTRVTDRNGNLTTHYFDASGRALKRIECTNRNVRPGEGNFVTRYEYTADGRLSRQINPRGNSTAYVYDESNSDRRKQGNVVEQRIQSNGIAGGGIDLVTRYTYEPVFNQRRTVTDARAFPTGSVPLVGGKLDLTDPLVQRYTTISVFDYQEGTGFQTARGVPLAEQIPEGLGDLNGAADFDEGNVVRIEHPTIQTPGPNFGDSIVEERTYNDRGQKLTDVDPLGHVTAYAYFPGNGTPQDPGDLEGYLQSRTVDAGGFGLTTSYSYDLAGNPTSIADPDGEETLLFPNALNQVVRTLSPRPFGAIRYQTDTFYDANDNIARTERANLDESGLARPHAILTEEFEYNILRYPVSEERDKTRNDGSSAGVVRTEYSYDGNLNVTAVRLPLAVGGAQPSNIVTYQYDERDLLYKAITGDDDTDPFNVPPATAAVRTRNYDRNRNLLEEIDSLSDAVSVATPTTLFPGSGPGDVTAYSYDGFDRLVSRTDPEANVTTYLYDAVSNRVQAMLAGALDHQGGAPVLLSRTDHVYDELDRLVRSDSLHRDTATQTPIGDGHGITEYEYDLDGKLVAVTDDRGLTTTTTWDAAERVSKTTDQLGDEIELAYDDNSNVVTRTQRDVSTDLATPTETYVTQLQYDGLDRLIRTTDPAGDVRERLYDSRGNVVRTTDGVRGTGHPGGAGNEIRYEYDGLDRLVRTECFLTTNGRGDGAPAGSIVTTQAWDDDSRLTTQTDDNGNATSYAYDALNRRTTTTYADGTSHTSQLDTDDHVVAWTDPNGTVCTLTYDGLDRLLARSVAPGAGVIGSTLEEFGYDGASRLTLARNDDGFNPGTMDCLFAYDTHSNRTVDDQGGLAVLSAHDGVGNRTQCTYPGQFGGGSRILAYVHDGLNRVQSISDAMTGTIATYHYKGPSRVERRTYGNGTKLDIAYDALPRAIDYHHSTSGGNTIARFQYGYDREHHRLFEKRVHDGNLGDVYSYDSVYRVTGNLQDVDLTSVSAGTEIQPEAYSSPDGLAYVYDGVGNRTSTTETTGGVPVVSTYSCNGGAPAFDCPVNQYTSVSGGLNLTLTHDDNGNLTSDGAKTYAYDFKNRLVEVRDQTTTDLIARYTCDAADRRAMKELFPSGEIIHYVLHENQVIEERDGSSMLVRQYVWGPGIDLLIEESTVSARYSSHEDANGSVCSLTDGAELVVERYRYDAFGRAMTILAGPMENEYLFHSVRLGSESGLYYMRARHYHAELGRFIQRDPLGPWHDDLNLGNGLAFVGNNATTFRDPQGLEGFWDTLCELPSATVETLREAFGAAADFYGSLGGGVELGTSPGSLADQTASMGGEVSVDAVQTLSGISVLALSAAGAGRVVATKSFMSFALSAQQVLCPASTEAKIVAQLVDATRKRQEIASLIREASKHSLPKLLP